MKVTHCSTRKPSFVLFTVFFVLACFTVYADTSKINVSDSKKEYYQHAVLKPISHDSVRLTAGFWEKVRTRSRDIGVPTLQVQFEKHGHVENFRICAEQADRPHFSGHNCNEFFYKQMEAMAWYAPESRVVKELLDYTRNTVLAAQQPDGYLNTFYENVQQKAKGAKRFQEMNRFEFYNFGHFTQAAIADFRASGNREMLDAAIKFSDLIVNKFADPKNLPYKNYRGTISKKYEHPNHELAMVELYRVTGDKRYLDFVMQTYTEYGYFDGEHFNEMWGHAVQENLLEAGAVDLYLETGDKRIWNVVSNLWNDMHDRKMYITGGTGSTGKGEAYGTAYELPNDTAYTETCAAIALTFWNHKMLLATGDAKYADEMDRTLFNNVLCGYGLNGWSYFYPNVLDWDPVDTKKREGRRFTWHKCPCCPPNLHRLFAALDQYIYTSDESGVQVNLFADSVLTHTLAGGKALKLTQKTAYPWSGEVTMEMAADEDAQGAVSIRIPGWCENFNLRVDGKPVDYVLKNGYAKINSPWRFGTNLVLDMAMKARIIPENPKVESQVGRIAFMRGPIVYCVEQTDNQGIDFDRLSFNANPKIDEAMRNELLDGIVQLTVSSKDGQPIKLIPYYSWANREPGRMMVWLRKGVWETEN